MNPATPFRAESVHTHSSALSIALKKIDREAPFPGSRDPYRLVKEEIQQFFEHHADHKNLSAEGLKDLSLILEMFDEMGQSSIYYGKF